MEPLQTSQPRRLIRWVTGLTCLLVVLNNVWHSPNNILSWDVYGYYLYLPQAFIQDDLSIQDTSQTMALMRQYQSTGTFYQAMKLENGKHVMKYSLGMAVTYAPFFAVGHGLAKITGQPQDGFSWPYQRSIFWGEILITLLGIFLLSKILQQVFSEWVGSLVLILIVFATNYTLHVTMVGQNAMSHNVLFTLYAALIWACMRWESEGKLRHAWLIGFTTGLAMLIRPTEVVALIIPFLWNVRDLQSLKERISLFWSRKAHILLAAVTFMLIAGLQVVYWKLVTGKFLFNSYGGNPGEGLNFDHPYLGEVLFGFRKGWLVYTPLMVLGILGLPLLLRQKNRPALAALVFFICNTYLISCWSTWWYGPSFSQRPFIASYPLMALGLGALLTWLLSKGNAAKIATLSLLFMLTALNLWQTMQYNRGVIDMDRMTAAAYRDRFWRLDPAGCDPKLLLVNRNRRNDAPIEFPELYDSVLIHNTGAMTASLVHADTLLWSTTYADISTRNHAYLRFELDCSSPDSAAMDAATLQATFENKGWPYATATWPVKGNGLQQPMTYLTPEVRYRHNRLELRLTLEDADVVALRGLKVWRYERRD